jgi:putative ABC transport system permease protein
MTQLIRVLTWLFERLARLAAPSDHGLAGDAEATFRAISRAAYDRGGVWRLALVSLREFVDLAVAIVRERREIRRDARRGQGHAGLAPLRRDLRLATRAVWSAKTASGLAAVTLALGIGTSAAVFSILDSVLLRQVPFPNAGRLVEIWNFSLDQEMSFRMGVPVAALDGWRNEPDIFERVEGFDRRSLVFEDERGARELSGALLTPGTLALLGARPVIGRGFQDHDARAGARPVALVSDSFWTNHLGRRRDLATVGIALDGVRHDVIGVMPATFRFPTGHEQVWIAGAATSVTPLALLREGLTVDAAVATVKARGERVATAAGGSAGLSATVFQLGGGVDAKTETALLVLAAAVALLFLIVCVNVANLTLSRALGRTRDLATCGALGASRGSLFRVVLLEQALTALVGVVAGAGVAVMVLQLAIAALPDVMTTGTLNAIDLDTRALWMLVATGVGTMLLCGVPPAWLATRVSVVSGLAHSGRTVAGSTFARRLRTTLAVSEVAMSVALLIGAAVITRSFIALTVIDHGYVPQGLVRLQLGLPAAGYKDADVADAAIRDVTERIRALPGVTGATRGGLPSESMLAAFGSLQIEGRPGVVDARAVVPVHEVDPHYFEVLQLPVRTGRAFLEHEIDGAAMINERFAATHFPAENPIGRRFRFGNGPWRTIVGVAGTTLGDQERGAPGAELYYPAGQADDAARPMRVASSIAHFSTVIVRSQNPAAVLPLLSGAVHDRDPSIVVWRTSLVERTLADAIARPRVVFATMAVFAVFGLTLAMVGLYGVLSHLVAQRRQEIGVRIALGAGTGDIRRMVLRHGLGLATVGIVLGVMAAWPLVRLMKSLLVEVTGADPLALIVAVALVGTTAALASWAPARRAGRTNPVELFRN